MVRLVSKTDSFGLTEMLVRYTRRLCMIKKLTVWCDFWSQQGGVISNTSRDFVMSLCADTSSLVIVVLVVSSDRRPRKLAVSTGSD